MLGSDSMISAGSPVRKGPGSSCRRDLLVQCEQLVRQLREKGRGAGHAQQGWLCCSVLTHLRKNETLPALPVAFGVALDDPLVVRLLPFTA
ncbi:hypothetical protein AAW14_27800 [Streptomyces hygroscopicus]|nr:hypothetical protein [Streptomyces hygroscopicus]